MARWIDVQGRIQQLERDLLAWYRSNEIARRIATVPGVGLLGATAMAASVTDATQFSSGRQFAAWLGLTPLNNSSGGKERLGRISKMGGQYLRRLLVTGMTSLVRRNKHHPSAAGPRVNALLARKPVRLVTVAMANRAARAIWAIMVRGESTGRRWSAWPPEDARLNDQRGHAHQRLRGPCEMMAHRSDRG